MERYHIRLNRLGNFLERCDDCWYESAKGGSYEGTPVYTREEAEALLRNQLRKHYIYSVTLFTEDGVERETLTYFRKKKPLSAPTLVDAAAAGILGNCNLTF